MNEEKFRLYYTATLIECISRKAKTTKSALVSAIKKEGVQYIFQMADALQQLSLEQAATQIIERYHIQTGIFPVDQTVGYTRTATSIGKYYADLVIGLQSDPSLYPDMLYQIFRLT